jgi:hypothetical protein
MVRSASAAFQSLRQIGALGGSATQPELAQLEQADTRACTLGTCGCSLGTRGCSLDTWGYSLSTYGCSLSTRGRSPSLRPGRVT